MALASVYKVKAYCEGMRCRLKGLGADRDTPEGDVLAGGISVHEATENALKEELWRLFVTVQRSDQAGLVPYLCRAEVPSEGAGAGVKTKHPSFADIVFRLAILNGNVTNEELEYAKTHYATVIEEVKRMKLEKIVTEGELYR